jgi:hypothetical protein
LLPFVSTIDCCGAARQTGHSLRVLNRWMVELTHCGQCRPLQLRLSLAQHFLAGAASRLLQCTIAVIKIRSRVSNPNNAFGASGSNNLVTQQAALIVLLICHAGYSSYARYFLVKATVAHLMDEYRLVI